jgi:hypothetical protein
MGFRLAQFLQMGWMDPELAYRRALYHEPLIATPGPETIHTLTLTDTGRIVGYVALVGSSDPVALPLDAPARGLFPAEVAHHVDLLAGFAAPGRDSHQVYEIKRFVRAGSMARGLQRDRVPWHLILALGRSALALNDPIQLVVGDSRENGALRHLRLIGFAPVVVADTRPCLPRTELMWPSYQQPELAKPFSAPVPDKLADYLDSIDAALAIDTATDWRREAIARLIEVHRAAGQFSADVASQTESSHPRPAGPETDSP